MTIRPGRLVLTAAIALLWGCTPSSNAPMANAPAAGADAGFDATIDSNSNALLTEGRKIFRYDTFGSEAFWGDQLHLHQAIAGEKNGGVGPGVSPKTALSLGLKVDAAALPSAVVDAIKAGKVDLDDPATTVTLLKLNAVVGVTGFFDASGKLTSMGIQCAFCHSTVDNSFAQGIGKRLDGWPNRDLNVGGIVSAAPNLKPLTDYLGVDKATLLKVLASWGPGKYDAEINQDLKAMRPDGKSAATLIPAAFGLAGQNLHTYTGWGSVPYWNAYVAITQMHGQGTFFDPRLDNAKQFPLAARNHAGNIRPAKDLVTAKLAALQYYQLSIPAPVPSHGSFDARAAEAGKAVFNGAAQCSTCHVPPLFTEPGWGMHTAAEIGIDDFQASRSPDKKFYRTTPLRGLFVRAKGGFYHDGRFEDLKAVVAHYNRVLNLALTSAETGELIEYLKSL
ncbi:MAG TPA: hypothetical protein VN518_02535 [Methyloceanibacter sp.]|nr:hypothetical protein [Methyloceanibacter sp.]